MTMDSLIGSQSPCVLAVSISILISESDLVAKKKGTAKRNLFERLNVGLNICRKETPIIAAQHMPKRPPLMRKSSEGAFYVTRHRPPMEKITSIRMC